MFGAVCHPLRRRTRKRQAGEEANSEIRRPKPKAAFLPTCFRPFCRKPAVLDHWISDSSGGLFGFRADLIEEGGELVAQGMIRSRFGFTSLLGEAGGEFQGPTGVGKAHLFEIRLIQALEIAFGNVEDGLGEEELAFAKGAGAGGGSEEIARRDDALGLGGLFGAAGGVGADPGAPVEIDGPALDGAEGDAGLAGDGGVAPARAEFKIGTKGGEGAVGFALSGGEGGGRGKRIEDGKWRKGRGGTANLQWSGHDLRGWYAPRCWD